MKIVYHPHAIQRMQERGASKKEVEETILAGERFKAKFDRVGFRRNFWYDKSTKQVE